MEEKNKNNQPPKEIPDNGTPPYEQPIKGSAKNIKPDDTKKHRQRMNGVKIAYAFALLLAFGGALAAKLATESSLGNINVPIESDYFVLTESTIMPSQALTEAEIDFEVRHNVTDVPDTREATQTTEKTSVITTEEPTTQNKFSTPYKDYYTLPLGTDILKDYSPTTPGYNATMGDWRTHGGIDFSGAEGSQVKAIAYGTVTDVYDDPIYGTVIEIDHGNEVTARYCGLNKDVVETEKGKTVTNGQLLGYLGTVPCEKADLSHLHFEIYYKGENVDPLALMSK